MNDLKSRWVVVVNGLYLCGLGQAFEGYRTAAGLPVGLVISRRRENAQEFETFDTAKAAAQGCDGLVVRA